MLEDLQQAAVWQVAQHGAVLVVVHESSSLLLLLLLSSSGLLQHSHRTETANGSRINCVWHPDRGLCAGCVFLMCGYQAGQ